MVQKAISHLAFILWIVLCCVLLEGCGSNDAKPSDSPVHSDSEGSVSEDTESENVKSDAPLRDSTPNVLVPAADQTVSYGTDTIVMDASHTDQGYVMVQYLGDNPKVKMQIEPPDGNTYTYLLSQEKEFETFPLPSGDGSYSITVLENVSGDMYAIAFSQDIDVTIADEFLPFLYPNQYVSFTSDSQTVKKGQDLVSDAHSDLEAVEKIYHFITENITYDTEKASSVSYGYLPDVDETLATGKGICFDYAASMAAMLRSQRIPTKLEIGYAGEAYHAWISTYIKDVGWIDDIIQFDGSSWVLMDPTFAAGANKKDLKAFIGDGQNYMVQNSY